MENYANGPEIPLGLGMALAKNNKAMQYYAGLSKRQQQEIIEQTHTISSKGEMQSFVNSLVKNNSL